MGKKANFLINRFETLKEDRRLFEPIWQEIETLLKLTPALKSNQIAVESTAAVAHSRFAAVLQMVLTPKDQQWHSLKAGNADIENEEEQEVDNFLKKLTGYLHLLRAQSNFSTTMNKVYRSLGAYGTAILYIDEDLKGGGINYKHVPLLECWVAENSQGKVDTVYREYKLTAKQAVEEFGLDKVSPKIKNAFESEANNYKKDFTFLHVVFPRIDYLPWKIKTALNMPIASYHIELEEKAILRESGYRVMPYIVTKYMESLKNDVYGFSPAMQVLDDLRKINQMDKTILRAAEKVVDPPLLLSDDNSITAFSLHPGALNFGGLDENGRQNVVPLQTNANIPLGLEMEEQKRKAINDAFLVTLFQVLQQTPQMTATEANYRKAEQADMLAPAMAGQQSTLLEPMIKREIDILENNGVFDDGLPEGLGEASIQYEAPLAKIQRGQDGMAIIQTMEAAAPIINMNPDLVDMFDLEKAIKIVAKAFGAPLSIFLKDDEYAMLIAQKQQQQQQQAQMAQAAQMAEAVNQGGQGLNQLTQASLNASTEEGGVNE